MSTLFSTLQSRGCLHDVSHPEAIEALLENEKIRFYCGFDPTADSLHVGSMLPLLFMRRMQKAGHFPIALLGTATGMIGDPSGKSEERKLLTADLIEHNAHCIEQQVGLFLERSGENAFELVRNDSWLSGESLISFLRDTGKHFSVNAMMAKESVKNRLENREQGISYTEFSYMLLQAFDFYWLHKHKDCRLQVGGSDQWGNITAGLELIRRRATAEDLSAFGFTFPLLTTASGTKFGKTEAGAVWLDPQRTSPYRFYQYWRNTEDADVIAYLKLFTDLEDEQITALAAEVESSPHLRNAQSELAKYVTVLVHGESEMQRAIQASEVLFGGTLDAVDSKVLLDIFSDVPSTTLPKDTLATGVTLVDLLVQCGLAKSKGAARRSIEAGGVYVNNKRTSNIQHSVSTEDAIDGSVVVLRSGKKTYHLLQLTV